MNSKFSKVVAEVLATATASPQFSKVAAEVLTTPVAPGLRASKLAVEILVAGIDAPVSSPQQTAVTIIT